MSLEKTSALVALCIVAASIIIRLLRFGQREAHLPPGPPTIPILGNSHQLSPRSICDRITQWTEQYGPVFSLKAGRNTIIVLNSRKAIHDLIDKRGAAASDRPKDEHLRTAVADSVVTMPNDEMWKTQRKIVERMVAPKRLDGELAIVQEAEINLLLGRLLDTPTNLVNHLKRTVASMASIVLCGQRSISDNDFWAEAAFRVIDIINPTIEPGTYIPVEAFPIMRFVPTFLNKPYQRAKEGNKSMRETWQQARRMVEIRRAQGDPRESLLDSILDGKAGGMAMSNRTVDVLIGSLEGAMADTTANQLLTHILHLAAYPEVQVKARQELDQACGVTRSPQWSDFEACPYVNCIIKEGNRLRPVTPINIPHANIGDFWYENMLIPDGATLLVSPKTLSCLDYVDPTSYSPDRFLKHSRLAPDYALSADYENRDHYLYGAGRRICPGMHLAERVQWRAIASLIWAFEIHPLERLDINAYEYGLLQHPKPFKVDFVPRSDEHVKIIRRACIEAEQVLQKWD